MTPTLYWLCLVVATLWPRCRHVVARCAMLWTLRHVLARCASLDERSWTWRTLRNTMTGALQSTPTNYDFLICSQLFNRNTTALIKGYIWEHEKC